MGAGEFTLVGAAVAGDIEVDGLTGWSDVGLGEWLTSSRCMTCGNSRFS